MATSDRRFLCEWSYTSDIPYLAAYALVLEHYL